MLLYNQERQQATIKGVIITGQFQHEFNKNDEYYTPAYAVTPILTYLKAGSTIWCPFDKEESEYVKIFKDFGFDVIHSHIEEGEDFFTTEVPKCDYIISNPPYSLKQKVIERLTEINKPYAMLINYQGLFDCGARHDFYSKNDIQLCFLYPRVNYITPQGETNSAPFQSVYISNNIFEKQLNYINIKQEKKDWEQLNKKERV